MKFRVLSCLLAVFILLSAISAHATENSTDSGLALTNPDAEKISDYSGTPEAGAIANEAQLKGSEGYYLHTLLCVDIVKAVQEGAEIKDLISENYSIIVPTENGYMKYRKNDDGTISYSGACEFNESTKSTNLVDISTVNDILSRKKYKNATDAVIFDAGIYYTSFVYFSVNDVEYLIPFCARPDFTGLKNGEVYKADDCLETLYATWGDIPTGDLNGGSAAPLSEPHKSNINYIIFGIAGAVLVFMCATVIYSLKKSKKKVTN